MRLCVKIYVSMNNEETREKNRKKKRVGGMRRAAIEGKVTKVKLFGTPKCIPKKITTFSSAFYDGDC